MGERWAWWRPQDVGSPVGVDHRGECADAARSEGDNEPGSSGYGTFAYTWPGTNPLLPNPGTLCGPSSECQVAVFNQNGTVLGTGDLGMAENSGTFDGGGCEVTTGIGRVPSATEYGVAVDGRSPVYFSQAEAEAAGYDLSITYGT